MMPIDPVALALTLVVATVFLAAVVVLIWWIDRYDREPWPLLLSVFLWGMVVAPGLVLGAGGLIGGITTWIGSGLLTSVVVAPLVEELAKGVGILLVVVFSQHFDNPTDGLVYGTAVGLGFAVTENLLYGIWPGSMMVPGEAVSFVFGRTLFAAGVHALASSMVGAGLGLGRTSGRRIWAVGWALLGLVVAVALHGGWNLALLTVPFK
ncbi:MAG: PrsW family intramembrane metalloprotease, partial [Acidobacteriota bacterium]